MPRKQARSNQSTEDYERLGRTLESIFEGGYINHRRVYRINFVRGIFFGIGSFIGGTIVVALVLWLLTLLSEIPLVNNLAETLQNTLDSN